MDDLSISATGRRSWRLLLVLTALGLAGVASLLLMPLEALLPAGVEVPRALLLVQPAVFVVAFSLLGWWAAPKLGLDAPVLGRLVEGGDWLGTLRHALPLALAGGVVSAGVLIVYGLATAGTFVDQAPAVELPMASRLLYGGVAEEIMLRWGLLSLIALAALKSRMTLPGALWTGNLVAALLFALGHLPALFALIPDPPTWLLGAVLLANASAGIVFGWLYIRRGLEAAMIGHALAHLLAVPLLTLIG